MNKTTERTVRQTEDSSWRDSMSKEKDFSGPEATRTPSLVTSQSKTSTVRTSLIDGPSTQEIFAAIRKDAKENYGEED